VVNHSRQQRGAPPEVEGAGGRVATEGKLSKSMLVRILQEPVPLHGMMRASPGSGQRTWGCSAYGIGVRVVVSGGRAVVGVRAQAS
jgi:hypothetical protein